MMKTTTSLAGRKRISSRSRQNFTLKVITWMFLLAGTAVFMLPFIWMVSVALSDSQIIFDSPLNMIPKNPKFSNFVKAWTSTNFTRFLFNTCMITFPAMFGQVFSAALVAFGFARINFPGKTFLFIILISTMMIPFQVTMIPTFLLFASLGWINTYLPLIVPAFFGGGAFFIFLLRQFFMTIPRDLDEAAIIDGCSQFGIFWRIMLPLSKPALTTVAVFSFIAHWNDFLGPLIYLNSPRMYTLAVGLSFFQSRFTGGTNFSLLMAASLIVLLPVLIVFFFSQRFFIEGITLTGIKG